MFICLNYWPLQISRLRKHKRNLFKHSYPPAICMLARFPLYLIFCQLKTVSSCDFAVNVLSIIFCRWEIESKTLCTQRHWEFEEIKSSLKGWIFKAFANYNGSSWNCCYTIFGLCPLFVRSNVPPDTCRKILRGVCYR